MAGIQDILNNLTKWESDKQKQDWINRNRDEINALWLKFEKVSLPEENYWALLGDPNDLNTQLWLKMVAGYQEMEPWHDLLTSKGITVPTFKEYNEAYSYIKSYEVKFGTTGNFASWIDAADEELLKIGKDIPKDTLKPGERVKTWDTRRLEKSIDLFDQYGTVENYQNQINITKTLGAYSDDIKRVFGEDVLRSGLLGLPGFEKIPEEVEQFNEVNELLKSMGMDTSTLNRNRLSSIINTYGGAGGYGKFLRAEEPAEVYAKQFREFAGLGFGQDQSTADLQERIFRGGEGSIQQQLDEFITRKKYLFAPMSTGGGEIEKGEPELGAWWRKE